MKAIRIRPLGPTHYGTRQIPSPATAARDDVWHMPPPSTLLGALGQLAGVKIQCEEKSPRGALKALLKLKEELGIRAIWGPIAVVKGAYVLPTLDGFLGQGPAEKTRRIGLALTPHKTAAPGHLYAATYAKPYEAIYFIDADQVPTGLVRLGGEGRLALIEQTQEDPTPWLPPKKGQAVLITPMLIPEGPPPCVKQIKNPRVVQWGLGYSEVCKQRRPLYPALPPGTHLEIENCNPTEGHLSQLGYGALANHKTPP
ncbi:MAG: type III-B CRISPR module-associated Cmr3 family protein [Pyrobaculum sp.]